MTAVKLSDKQTVTTVNEEFIPLVSSTGAVFKISKTNLAKAMREAFPAATTIGADDKIPIFQGGADKLLPFQVFCNAVKRSNRVSIPAGSTHIINDSGSNLLMISPLSSSAALDIISTTTTSVYITASVNDAYIVYNEKDAVNKLSIYMEGGNLVLKNNKNTNQIVSYYIF